MKTRATAVAVSSVFGERPEMSVEFLALPPRGVDEVCNRGDRTARKTRSSKSRIRVAVLFVGFVISSLVLVPSAPAQDCPELVGRWPYGQAGAVAVSGTFAYLGSGTVLLVVDVSNAAAPQVVAEVVLPGLISDVAISGNYAYVATNYDGLRVIDVSTPASPIEVGNTPGGGGG
jgi:hypothetical protein